MPNDPGRPVEALRIPDRPPPEPSPDQWIREQLRRTADKPAPAPPPARQEPPAAVRMPIESLRPGALPAGGARARDPDEWVRDMLWR